MKVVTLTSFSMRFPGAKGKDLTGDAGMVSQNNATGQCCSAGETNQNMEMSLGASDVPPIHANQECEKLQASVVRLATECSVLEGELMKLYEESRELSAENDRLMKLTETLYPPDANSDIVAVNSASASGESPSGRSFVSHSTNT